MIENTGLAARDSAATGDAPEYASPEWAALLWEKRLIEFAEFVSANSALPRWNGGSAEKSLYNWVLKQRSEIRRGELPTERRAQFEAVMLRVNSDSIPAAQHFENWRRSVRILAEFRVTLGRWPSRRSTDPAEKKSGDFRAWQQKANRQRKLSDAKRAVLDDLVPGWEESRTASFVGESLDEVWERNFQEYVAFVQKHGRTPLQHTEGEELYVANWRKNQQQRATRGILRADRVRMLNSAEHKLKVHYGRGRTNRSWEASLDELKVFVRTNGRLPRYLKDGSLESQLAPWFAKARHQLARGGLTPEQAIEIEELMELMPSRDLEAQWEACFTELVEFISKTGSAPTWASVGRERVLYNWVCFQRRQIRSGNLSDERRERLQAVLPASDHGHNRRWRERAGEFSAFVQREGRRPAATKKKPKERSLYGWLHQNRVAYRNGTMPEERRLIFAELLEQIS